MAITLNSSVCALFLTLPSLSSAQESCPTTPAPPPSNPQVRVPAGDTDPIAQVRDSIDSITVTQKAPIQPKIETVQKDTVFKGAKAEHPNCKYVPGFKHNNREPDDVFFEQRGWSLDSTTQTEVLHCRSQNLITMRLDMEPLLCKSTAVYVVLDRSGSMTRLDAALKNMMREVLALERSQESKDLSLFVTTSSPLASPLFVSGKTSQDAADRAFAEDADLPEGDEFEEQGFLSMLNLIQQNPQKPDCAELVILSDEPEQSSIELSAEEFLGKAQTLFGTSTWVKLHSYFTPKCSAYNKASELSGGLISNDQSLKELTQLATHGNVTPIFPPHNVQVVLSADLDEPNPAPPLKGDSKGWIWLESSKGFLYSSEHQDQVFLSDVPKVTYFHYLSDGSQRSDRNSATCEEE